MKEFSEAQVKDWMDHPEAYDFATDDNFARFQAWIQIQYEQLEAGVKPELVIQPVCEEVIKRVEEMRQTRH